MTKEQKFYKALQDVFIGAKIEGKGGFINLMRIKFNYYRKIENVLKEDIETALKSYPKFRDELFDKLYSFFSRYFTESGSIYFNSTPFHNNIYEKVYTDEKDVILFWKTQMLYYVKTDRIFRSLPVEFDGFKFFFDASKIESKKANEKRSLVFNLNSVREDSTIVFDVQYSERGTKTKQDEILKAIKLKGITITEEQLLRAFKVFEKQNEVDFFINKNAKSFLQEQFKLWSYQYFWEGAKEWSNDRVNQLQILKDIAFKIIDFISQFEDELVKIWNKPKFVKNSNYVITLDRITDKKLVEKIKKHINYLEQIKEWKELGIDKDTPKAPIDTKYFKDLELEILSQFDNLDKSLDGWLIKSENYQALNTILPKFKERVRVFYIDPPYNTGNDEFMYSDTFFHSSWLSFIYDRLNLSKKLLRKDGIIFTSIGDLNPQEGESYKLQHIQSEIFDKRLGTLIWKKRGGIGSFSEKNMTENHEYITVFGNQEGFIYKNIISEENKKKYKEKDSRGLYRWMELVGPSQQTKEKRPNLDYGIIIDKHKFEIIGFEFNEGKIKKQHFFSKQKQKFEIIRLSGKATWLISRDIMKKYYDQRLIKVFNVKDKFTVRIKRYLFNTDGTVDGNILKSILLDNSMKVGMNVEGTKQLNDLFFPYEYSELKPKPTSLIKLLIYTTTLKEEIIGDFFAGSGTTAHSVLELNSEDCKNRKFLLVEMGNYFEKIIIPRLKKLSYSLYWKEGKPTNNDGCSIFFKYYELEQYEEALANSKIIEVVKPIFFILVQNICHPSCWFK